MQKQFSYDSHHWGANKKVIEIINERENSPETLQIIERRQEIAKRENHLFKFDSSLNRNVSVPQRLDKRGRDEVPEIDPELPFWNNEKNRWAEVTLSSTNRNSHLVTKNQVHRNKTQLNPNQYSAPKKARWRNLRRISKKSTSKTTISPKRQYFIFQSIMWSTNQKQKTRKQKELCRKPSLISWLIWKLWYTKLRWIPNTTTEDMSPQQRKKIDLPKNSLRLSAKLPNDLVCHSQGTRLWFPDERTRPVTVALHFGHPG